MKLVFLTDVPNIAKEGDVKEVSDGYGRNFLVPKGLARDAKTDAEIASLGSQLSGKEITIRARVGVEGHLHGAVTTNDIAAALEALGINVDKRKIELAEPIHDVGPFEIPIRLSKDVIPMIKVVVLAET
jgi:large subunit ribosomal protein L9